MFARISKTPRWAPSNSSEIERTSIWNDYSVENGAALGSALGWLVGVGALAIPGVGPVIAAGPLVAAVAGIGIGGALGGFAGSLIVSSII